MEEEEVVLGLIPAADWVENRPLEEGGEIELAAVKKLQHCLEADQLMEIKPKKEKEDIEEITLDSEEEEIEEAKMKPGEVFNVEADTPFQQRNEVDEIETTEEKHHIEATISFSAGEEDGEMKVKQEEELQIEASTDFPEAQEDEEVNMREEEGPHIEAVTVFSDSDEGENIHVKEEEELQIEAVTVYSDTEGSEEDCVSGKKDQRYNAQDDGGNPLIVSVAPPQPTVIESVVQDVYGCSSCSMSFSCTAEVSKHVRSHPPRRKPFICRVCLKTDTLASNLKRHMRTHSGEKPYSCVLCFKMFTSAYSLKIHKRIHSGYKPYTCKQCPRSFYQKTDLNKHSVAHYRSMQLLQSAKDLLENTESNLLKRNVKVRNPSTAKVFSRGAASRVPHILCRTSPYVLSPPSSMARANGNSITDDSQTESSTNALHDSPPPFAPVITEVVGSFHEEDSEVQPCPSPLNNGERQKQEAFNAGNLSSNQIRMEKAVYTQPVMNSVNPQCTNNTVALQDTAISASSSAGKQLTVKKNIYKQPEMFSVSSQNDANLGTTLLSPVQLPTNVVQNNVNSAATAPNTGFANNFMPKQTGGEMFCIPLIINGQMCYAIPAPTPSQLSVVSNPSPVQTAVQPVSSHNIPSQETFLLPVFVPPISNDVPNSNSSQPMVTPAVTPQTLVLGNATPSQSQHQIGFQSAPVSTVTDERLENSSGSQIATGKTENFTGSQMTTVKTVSCVQPGNFSGSQMTTVETAPRDQLESSFRSQATSVKTLRCVWPENPSGSQMTTVKTVSRIRQNNQFMLPPPPATDVKRVDHYDHHHNHDLTVTKKGSNGIVQHERVYCNTCNASVSVFTKRGKHKKVS
ncbi:zinc finger protein 628-like isoform X1 [Schistocerca cancellata]|uniref:zinc finger protein 628-like isoform X1 n=2 Tax=Schistocerca cancellata TaxID=274614 RepID=UPI002119B385|nr:zinc finger protein 628-like isoform X1 [Schistocerca cancellata]